MESEDRAASDHAPEQGGPAPGELAELVPDVVPWLRPGDRIAHVELLTLRVPAQPPSALRSLLVLANVASAREIGANGPVVASRATNENQDVSSELRLFETVFCRDALRVALFLSETYPALARATVVALAAVQGVEEHRTREEEPGRIPHELRDPSDPVAIRITQEQGWGWPYYGSVDATPLFVQLVVECWRTDPQFLAVPVQGRDGLVHPVGHFLDRSIDWLCRRMDASPLGFVEYGPVRPGGMENQSWRDSWDAFVHADGQLANHSDGIAALDVQALAFDALLGAARLHRVEARVARATELEGRARRLWSALHRYLWVEDAKGGFFAVGLDRDDAGNARPLAVRTSEIGHLLASGVLDGDEPQTVQRREAVVRALFDPELLGAAGIRTLSRDEVRFHPGGYHVGSSWLWDTCLAAIGLDRHGYHGLATELRRRVAAVIERYRKFPEFARGGDEPEPLLNDRVVDVWSAADRRRNRFEQPPQEVQAWTVAACLEAKRRQGRRALSRPGALPKAATGPQQALEVVLLGRTERTPPLLLEAGTQPGQEEPETEEGHSRLPERHVGGQRRPG